MRRIQPTYCWWIGRCGWISTICETKRSIPSHLRPKIEAARRFTFILKGGGGGGISYNDSDGEALDGPFPGFRFFKALRNLSVKYSKIGLKGAQFFLWKVYEKDASSTVVRVSKGPDLNGNLLILNFFKHPCVLIPPRAVSRRHCILIPFFFLKHFTLSL